MKFDVIHREITKLRDEIKAHPQASEPQSQPGRTVFVNFYAGKIGQNEAYLTKERAEAYALGATEIAVGFVERVPQASEPAPSTAGAAPDTREMEAVGALLASMHEHGYEGAKVREAMQWALGYAALQSTAQPERNDLNDLAKVYASSYASPHHITFTINGLAQLVGEARCAQPERKPLTVEQKLDMLAEANRGFNIEKDDYFKAVEDAEAAHGIKGGQQ
jgi:hypothetical protein